ncbi:VCBS repeat-containing protein [Galbibacter mesophilus]|uniref:VCBS repeat-containing protein n=1 Tax=Galbibacter mesophilus TaxID=379069 RepID=UPI00191F5440|nr:VCBS repeat-containing protein [Galbibacter mesophilus]MCM5661909.1 VCBS repeat-containing protein [Galbibacter mesophilus]
MQKIFIYIPIAVLLLSCNKEQKLFTLQSPSETNIYFKNQLTSTPELNILTYLYFYNGAGVAAGDFNNDGWLDLYFTANQTEDKLYINSKNLQFRDVTQLSNIKNDTGWTTGVTTVDINNDGLLDIYVCKVGALSPSGHNLLFVNQGNDDKGIPIFNEEAKNYGLDIATYATQSAFFDYDKDGDLDMYLLNHSTHPNRMYGMGQKRNSVDSLYGDRFYRNDGGRFVDVSKEVRIHQGGIGYGLGLAVSDVNNDDYPDIYVGNDFFENDYLYINQGNGQFIDVSETDETILGHTTHYSMGNDIADINNDGNFDIVSVDMLPENLESYKTSGTEYNFQTYSSYLKNGYHPQYMQNTLHLNSGEMKFQEIAHISGIAATEWSWAPLLADFDNDGKKDLYITNGILGATNDMDFINFIANENIQKRLGQNMKEEDMAFIKEIPEKHVPNYFFKNENNANFVDATEDWFERRLSYSNGAVYADLDNDGDLDLVVNNVNEEAFVLKNNNREKQKSNNYLKINFKGPEKNKLGIGTKVNMYLDSITLSAENYVTRGFMSAVAPELHFGLGNFAVIDSLEVIWPDGKTETIKNPSVNGKIIVKYANAERKSTKGVQKNTSYLENVDSLISFKHKDFTSVEFNRDPLIPYANTNQGPKVAVGDVNGDGLEDVFIGGAKMQASALFLQQKEGDFYLSQPELFEPDAKNEDVDNCFFDADNDGDLDLMVVSGGNEFTTGAPLQPRLYRNESGILVKDTLQFRNIFLNTSSVKAVDIDNDDDLDLCITSNGAPRSFAENSSQFIFENDGSGNFKDITEEFAIDFQKIGNVESVAWADLNDDGLLDLIAVGKWMPISMFINDGKALKLQNNHLENTSGWWNCIETGDFDKDGDIDIVVGNFGNNTRLKATQNTPITLYKNDFDDNGSAEPIVTYFYKGEETLFSSKDELVKQMPFLNKKFLSYNDFAKASFKELLPKEKIETAEVKKVYELKSLYLENLGGGEFKTHILPQEAQLSAIYAIEKSDFNNDGFEDLLLVGNNYEISTQLGRQDAFHGLLLLNDQKGFFVSAANQNFNVSGPARDIKQIRIKDKTYYIITINNNKPVILLKKLP